MAFIEDLKIESSKQRGLIATWNWSNAAMNTFDRTNVTTIIRLFSPNDVIQQSITLSNSQSTKYVFQNVKDVTVKLCINVSFPEERFLNSIKSEKSQEICKLFTSESWPSVHVSLGSSFAAFVVLLLIVGLIFFTQKLGKKRRVMDKKTSIKRKPRDSYMYIYPDMKMIKTDQIENVLLDNDVKCKSDSRCECECNVSKVDGESIYDIESLDSTSGENTSKNTEKKDYEIIKCDCGLIHLVGTETECDDFLQKPIYYSQHVPLAFQDTISVETNSSL